MTPRELLQRWLEARLDAPGVQWLRDAIASVPGPGADRALYRAISLVARKIGKAPLDLDAAALAAADVARPGWDASLWSVDQAARICLLLAADGGSEAFAQRLDQLCATADIDELVAFYRGLPLYPDPARHRDRAAEGLRSNMRVVFEAVAHRNPYPAEQLGEDAWNQMVLKALFVGSALDPVVGIDSRANPTLARMLGDYAHERWAAQRPVSPQLWRCVGPFATGRLLADVERVLASGQPPERAAAVLALRSAPAPEARQLLERHAALRDAVAARGTGWASVADFE